MLEQIIYMYVLGLYYWYIKVFRISELNLINLIIFILYVLRLQNMYRYYLLNTVYYKGYGERFKYYFVFCYFLYNLLSEFFYLVSL